MYLLALSLIVGTTGCVGQREADDLRVLYRKSQGQILDLQAQLEEKDAQIDALRNASDDASMADDLAQAIAERDKLRGALQAAEDLLRESGGQPLPRALSDALAELAEMHPGLMSYDKSRGMIQLRSDLTFALGSATIRSDAVTSINRLASIFSSAAAQPYEVRLVGHTDNVPVKNPVNVRQYGDNWGLSAFRAIAVKDVLQKAGISPTRMSIAGYGEHRPIVANGPKGAQANRRVEIYLVAVHPADESAATSSAPTTTPDVVPEQTPETYEEPSLYK